MHTDTGRDTVIPKERGREREADVDDHIGTFSSVMHYRGGSIA